MKKAIIVVLFFSIWPYTVLGGYLHADSGGVKPICDWMPPKTAVDRNPQPRQAEVRRIGQDSQGNPRYESCSDAIKRAKKQWVKQKWGGRNGIVKKGGGSSTTGGSPFTEPEIQPQDTPTVSYPLPLPPPEAIKPVTIDAVSLDPVSDYPRNSAGVAVQGFPSVKGAGDFLYEAEGTVVGMGGSGGLRDCVLNKETGSVRCTSESCSSETTEYRRINPKTGKPYIPAPNISWGWGTTGSSGSTQ